MSIFSGNAISNSLQKYIFNWAPSKLATFSLHLMKLACAKLFTATAKPPYITHKCKITS